MPNFYFCHPFHVDLRNFFIKVFRLSLSELHKLKLICNILRELNFSVWGHMIKFTPIVLYNCTERSERSERSTSWFLTILCFAKTERSFRNPFHVDSFSLLSFELILFIITTFLFVLGMDKRHNMLFLSFNQRERGCGTSVPFSQSEESLRIMKLNARYARFSLYNWKVPLRSISMPTPQTALITLATKKITPIGPT